MCAFFFSLLYDFTRNVILIAMHGRFTYDSFYLKSHRMNEMKWMNERTTKPSVVWSWCVCCAEMWCTFIWAKPNRTEPRAVWLFSFIRSHLNGYICISIECERQSWIDDSGKATHLHLIFCTCCWLLAHQTNMFFKLLCSFSLVHTLSLSHTYVCISLLYVCDRRCVVLCMLHISVCKIYDESHWERRGDCDAWKLKQTWKFCILRYKYCCFIETK